MSPVVAAPIASLVVIGWFLWPFPDSLGDPVRSAFAAFRALALFVVALGATNGAASSLPIARTLFARCAVGFAFAFIIVGAISLGLSLSAISGASHVDLRSLIVSSTADAFWCAVALGVYYLLSAPSSPNRL